MHIVFIIQGGVDACGGDSDGLLFVNTTVESS